MPFPPGVDFGVGMSLHVYEISGPSFVPIAYVHVGFLAKVADVDDVSLLIVSGARRDFGRNI